MKKIELNNVSSIDQNHLFQKIRDSSIWNTGDENVKESVSEDINIFKKKFRIESEWYNNFYIVSTVVYLTSIAVGTIFYIFVDGRNNFHKSQFK